MLWEEMKGEIKEGRGADRSSDLSKKEWIRRISKQPEVDKVIMHVFARWDMTLLSDHYSA